MYIIFLNKSGQLRICIQRTWKKICAFVVWTIFITTPPIKTTILILDSKASSTNPGTEPNLYKNDTNDWPFWFTIIDHPPPAKTTLLLIYVNNQRLWLWARLWGLTTVDHLVWLHTTRFFNPQYEGSCLMEVGGVKNYWVVQCGQ